MVENLDGKHSEIISYNKKGKKIVVKGAEAVRLRGIKDAEQIAAEETAAADDDEVSSLRHSHGTIHQRCADPSNPSAIS